jgi:hypothetical protein
MLLIPVVAFSVVFLAVIKAALAAFGAILGAVAALALIVAFLGFLILSIIREASSRHA